MRKCYAIRLLGRAVRPRITVNTSLLICGLSILRELRFALFVLVHLPTMAPSPYRWISAPAPAELPGGYKEHVLQRPDGARIVYLEWNPESRSATDELGPVLFLHGGMASSECWSSQIDHVLRTYRPEGKAPWVISIDSRGQGRSTFGKLNFPTNSGVPDLNYTQMGDDTVAVLDALSVERARIVGWSDGAILILDFLLRFPQRIGTAYAFAFNYNTQGMYNGPKSPAMAESAKWAREIYERVNPSPKWSELATAVMTLWATHPNWALEDFKRVARVGNPRDAEITTTTPGVPNDTARVWIVDGDHEECVAIEQSYELAKVMPQTTLLILPGTSHFAQVQDVTTFNATLDSFLAYQPPKA